MEVRILSDAHVLVGQGLLPGAPSRMNSLSKYLIDYFQFRLSLIVGGRKNYEAWRAKNYSLKQAKLKNEKLAEEMERECQKNAGFLTYAEFLHLDQFGANGYHATFRDHGITFTHKHWGKALAVLCKKDGISHVLEFGPGAGDLAFEILKESQKIDHAINWSGVELNQDLQKEIKLRFLKTGFKDRLTELVSDITQLKTRKKSIIIFSYSLDSIPPQIFVNTKNVKIPPNALIGVTLSNGILREIVMEPNELAKKGATFENGVFKKGNGISFDLSSWRLHPGQRAYVPIEALSTLADFADKFPTSAFVIIDEFRSPPYFWETGHLGIPKDLHRFRRDIEDLERGYKEAGENLLYYPIYFITFYKFLHALGFRSIKYDIEQRMAKEMSQDNWRSLKGLFSTYAFIARDKKRAIGSLPIEFPKSKFI